MIDRIKEMHEHFGLTSEVPFTSREWAFRVASMEEELDEFKEATCKADELDALVDLLVFTLGTVERMGYADVLDEAFNRVMDANMAKRVGANQKRGSFELDLVKPHGWTAPNLEDLV